MIDVSTTQGGASSLLDTLPDLTPMLDILFIVLVFLLLTTGTVFQSLELVLPPSTTDMPALSRQPQHIVLAIGNDSYAVNDQTMPTFKAMQQAIRQAIATTDGYEIIIAGEKSISLERMLNVLQYLQTQGVAVADILLGTSNNLLRD